ncbi:POK6 protein, partial [Alectura lathami]|nr:POK6 protein [Alectura lathami]
GSPQVVELRAVLLAFTLLPMALNIFTDSVYVANLLKHLDQAVLYNVKEKPLFQILLHLWNTVRHSSDPYFVMHLRSHTNLPGFFVEGNAQADAVVAAPAIKNVPNIMQQAVLSHRFFHQGANALRQHFKLSHSQARAVLAACPDCRSLHVPTYYGTNPRGLGPLQIWQTDVTHLPEFGRSRYVHVSIDTYSQVIVATACCGESAKDVIKHFYHAFSMLGARRTVKTDNGPACISQKLHLIFQEWGIQHVTGIPHNPTGQAVVE